MIKYALAATLLLSSAAVNALDFEVGIGYTWFHEPMNGMWYQSEFEHSLDMESPSLYLGVRYSLTPSIDLLAGYKRLGSFKTSAIASASDHNYADYQAGVADIWPLSTWIGSGKTDGIVISGEYGFGDFFVRAGAYVHRTDWSVHIPDWRCPIVDDVCVPDSDSRIPSDFTRDITAAHEPDWMVGWLIGAGYQVTDDVSISYEIYNLKAHNPFTPANRGVTRGSLSINYRF